MHLHRGTNTQEIVTPTNLPLEPSVPEAAKTLTPSPEESLESQRNQVVADLLDRNVCAEGVQQSAIVYGGAILVTALSGHVASAEAVEKFVVQECEDLIGAIDAVDPVCAQALRERREDTEPESEAAIVDHYWELFAGEFQGLNEDQRQWAGAKAAQLYMRTEVVGRFVEPVIRDLAMAS